MSRSEQNYSATEDAFSLAVDQYGRVWLLTKLEGVDVTIDLGPKDLAFGIMAATMTEHEFDFSPMRGHEDADNDDERESGI